MSEVLALKYRPQAFDEVIGQDETVNQLSSALDNQSLGHALIFAGTRGCGKTTSARIVARVLNPDLSDAEMSMVVTEVDAASNTGVDSVRELIENIRYSTKGHKVIILDEAHMLSKNAFNALLKTLEEPPPNTTFILSTTEPHKLIPTVRSRCQLYEFKDVDVDVLAAYYKEVAVKESLDIDGEALHDVAIRAEGSVRDGLTILQKYLSGESVESNASIYFDLVSALYQADVATALALVADLRQKEDGRVIIQTLEKWFYWCSLENFGMKTPARQHFPGDAPVFDLTHLQNLFNTCLEVERNFAATPNSKSVLEMGIIRLCL
jgi:DNA polymerase-3 subunit gamma/tau